jgi:phosphoglycolate phosphatase-like HAD superfamily hydrolase
MTPMFRWCFDVDGTLLDQRRRYVAIHGTLVTQLGGTPVADYWERRRAGANEGELLCLADVPALFHREYDRRREHLLETPQFLRLDRPLPGARDLLALLHGTGRDVCVITNRMHRDHLERQLRRHGLSPYIHHYLLRPATAIRAPLIWSSTDGLRQIAEYKANAMDRLLGPMKVLVGDGPPDILAARLANCPSIAVSTGAYGPSALKRLRPTVLIQSLKELARLDPAAAEALIMDAWSAPRA